jgi:mono/diheme cytochrome c family protein
MIGNLVIILVLIAGVVFFAWLARSAWCIRQPIVRWALTILAALPALLFTLITGVIVDGYAQVFVPRSGPIPNLAVTSTGEPVIRGEHLAVVVCASCHSTTGQLPLSGGKNLSADSPLPIGTLVPPNLTPGGELQDWSDGEIARAIHDGIDRHARTLLMPVGSLRNLSDEDLAAIIAYLRSQPAVQNDTPPVNPSPLLAFFFGAGLAGQLHFPPTGSVAAPPHAPTAEYGAYIVSYHDCRTCHGADLNDGNAGGLGVPAPSARAIVAGWSLDQFIQTMRTGVDPGGHAIQPPMAWQAYGQMDDVELTALYTYLRSLTMVSQ